MEFLLKIKESRFGKKAASVYKRYGSYIVLFLLAFAINLAVESLCRRHFLGGIRMFMASPEVFLFNSFIIMTTLSVANFFPKQGAIYFVISTLWLVLGLLDNLVQNYRTTPLSATDFEILSSVLEIFTKYLKWWQIVGAIILFVGILAFLIYRIIKGKKVKVNFVRAVICVLGSVALMTFTGNALMQRGAISSKIGNLVHAYNDYGFAYCFSSSVVDRGINEPKDYSTQSVDEIIKMVGETNAEPETTPNIVMVQLESFFDVNYMRNITYSENPIPEFTKLKENYTSGFLTVPSFGAGTVNTEFEILTGMSLDYFGAGELPYKTVLKNKTCETINYNLLQLGYSTHAIHNHSASFYSRFLVYPNMGFDTFQSLEYMENVDKNPIGWAKDNVLIEEIFKALNSTQERDFVYAVSVQPHGQYPDVYPEGYEKKITVNGIENPEFEAGFSYYINQMYETDKFVGDLVNALKRYRQPVILVLYGDHLPNFTMTSDMVTTDDLYKTEYVMWSNYNMEKENKDLYTYQLSAYVLGRAGINNGIITKLHQNFSENQNYQRALEMIEYDMLYGNMQSYENAVPYEPREMGFGIDKIELKSARQIGSYMYVTGDHFTRHSKVVLDGKKKKTVYINSNTLLIANEPDNIYETLCVTQYGNNGNEYTSTNVLENPDMLQPIDEEMLEQLTSSEEEIVQEFEEEQ